MTLVHLPNYNSWGTFTITASIAAIAAWRIYRIASRKHTQCNALALPGPSRLPLVGNLFQIPSDFLWLACRNWCKELSETTF